MLCNIAYLQILIIILYSNELQEININELCLINYVVVLVKQNLSL